MLNCFILYILYQSVYWQFYTNKFTFLWESRLAYIRDISNTLSTYYTKSARSSLEKGEDIIHENATLGIDLGNLPSLLDKSKIESKAARTRLENLQSQKDCNDAWTYVKKQKEYMDEGNVWWYVSIVVKILFIFFLLYMIFRLILIIKSFIDKNDEFSNFLQTTGDKINKEFGVAFDKYKNAPDDRYVNLKSKLKSLLKISLSKSGVVFTPLSAKLKKLHKWIKVETDDYDQWFKSGTNGLYLRYKGFATNLAKKSFLNGSRHNYHDTFKNLHPLFKEYLVSNFQKKYNATSRVSIVISNKKKLTTQFNKIWVSTFILFIIVTTILKSTGLHNELNVITSSFPQYFEVIRHSEMLKTFLDLHQGQIIQEPSWSQNLYESDLKQQSERVEEIARCNLSDTWADRDTSRFINRTCRS